MQIIKPNVELLDDVNGDEILRKIELCGRVAYKSENKITEGSSREFVRKIINNGHHSVLEHVSLSIRFIIDRGIANELTRHRLCSFTQSSTRYINFKKHNNYDEGIKFIIPDKIAKLPNYDVIEQHLQNTELIYNQLIEDNVPPQFARSILPLCLETEVIMTCNLRELRHILSLRCATGSHPQIIEVMKQLLVLLNERIPVVFEDLYTKYIRE